jgi:hypothetical protein
VGVEIMAATLRAQVLAPPSRPISAVLARNTWRTESLNRNLGLSFLPPHPIAVVSLAERGTSVFAWSAGRLSGPMGLLDLKLKGGSR